MKRHLWLLPLIILAFAVRLYKIDNPIADWHSFRQADTASVSLEFYRHGINLFVPRYLDISNIQSGVDNPQGYRMVEFPLFNAIHATIAHLVPYSYFDEVGRLLSVFFSLLVILFLYLIVNHLLNQPTALLAATVMALAPFNVYYSRTVLPESLGLMLLTLGCYLFLRFRKQPSPIFFLSSAVSLALAVLVRPYVLFFFIPLYAFIIFDKHPLFKKVIYLLVFSAIVFLPFYFWRRWIISFPAGIPASAWLFDLPAPLRFHPAWWRWLFAERLSKLILGYFGSVLLVLGLLTKPSRKSGWFFHLWFLGILAYFSIFAGGNVTHDYYQAVTFPALAVLVAIGLKQLLTPNHFIWPLSFLTGIVLFVLFLGFSFYEIKGYYQVNHWSIVTAGKYADSQLPANAKIIAPYFGDTAFLYQTRRSGWPLMTYDLPRMLSLGATHYLSVNYDDTTNLVLNDPRFKIITKNPDFVLVNLRP